MPRSNFPHVSPTWMPLDIGGRPARLARRCMQDGSGLCVQVVIELLPMGFSPSELEMIETTAGRINDLTSRWPAMRAHGWFACESEIGALVLTRNFEPREMEREDLFGEEQARLFAVAHDWARLRFDRLIRIIAEARKPMNENPKNASSA